MQCAHAHDATGLQRSSVDRGRRAGECRGLEDPQQPEPLQDRPVRENHDERKQIEPQRNGPQQWHRRDIDGKVRRDAHQERRGHQGQRQPPQAAEQRDRRMKTGGKRGVIFRSGGIGGRRRTPSGDPHCGRAQSEEGNQQPVAGLPPLRLHGQRQVRLDHERIGGQSGQAAQIAGRIEKIGVFRRAPAALGEPDLQHRRAGRNTEERQPHADRQQHQEPGRGVALAGRYPALGHTDRQADPWHAQEHDVQQGLPPRAKPLQRKVGIDVARHQTGLIKHEARIPDRGRPAQPSQHHFGEHRLDDEHQCRAKQDRGRKNELHKDHQGLAFTP